MPHSTIDHRLASSTLAPVAVAAQLRDVTGALEFPAPVAYVYRPLEYAWAAHERYLKRYGQGQREVLFVGMNPGPWGMAQTGVPFGDIPAVRDWMGIEAQTGRPPREHPGRPVRGFACPRREVSGQRLWGWAQVRFGAAEQFFEHFFVVNYCPLCFIESSGRNRTPDKLRRAERAPLFAACDAALRALAKWFRPSFVVGIGVFAEQRARAALPEFEGVFGRIPHPSPASPAANRGWADAAEAALRRLGIPHL